MSMIKDVSILRGSGRCWELKVVKSCYGGTSYSLLQILVL